MELFSVRVWMYTCVSWSSRKTGRSTQMALPASSISVSFLCSCPSVKVNGIFGSELMFILGWIHPTVKPRTCITCKTCLNLCCLSISVTRRSVFCRMFVTIVWMTVNNALWSELMKIRGLFPTDIENTYLWIHKLQISMPLETLPESCNYTVNSC